MRFGFGDNWIDYLATIDEAKIEASRRRLKQIVNIELKGKSFIDIGCGSYKNLNCIPIRFAFINECLYAFAVFGAVGIVVCVSIAFCYVINSIIGIIYAVYRLIFHIKLPECLFIQSGRLRCQSQYAINRLHRRFGQFSRIHHAVQKTTRLHGGGN